MLVLSARLRQNERVNTAAMAFPRRPKTLAPARAGTSRNYQGFIALAIAVLAGLMLGVGIPLLQGRAVSSVDLLLGLLATLTLLPSSLALLRQDGDLLQPLPVVGGLFFLYYAVRAAYLADGSPDIQQLAPNIAGDFRLWIGPAITLNLACWVAAAAGYTLPVGAMLAKRLPAIRWLRQNASTQGIVILWCIGVLFRVLAMAQGVFLAFATASNVDHSTQSYVGLLSQLDLVAVFLLSAKLFKGQLSERLRLFLFAVVLPESILVGFISGSKLLMLMPVVFLFTALHYFRRRLGMREILGLLAVLGFVVMPLGASMRTAYGETSTGNVTDFNADTTVDTARLAVSQVQSQASVNPGAFLQNTLLMITSRVNGLDSSMVALKMTPNVLPWADPSAYYLAPVNAFVPRILWPSKPIRRAVPNWETDYWGGAEDAPTSIAVTNNAGLYLAFGWSGAVIGMLLLGIFWRVLYEWHRGQASELAWCSYILLLRDITDIEGDVTGVYVGLTRTFLLALLVAWIAAERPGRAVGH